jgi:hypothetical protein
MTKVAVTRYAWDGHTGALYDSIELAKHAVRPVDATLYKLYVIDEGTPEAEIVYSFPLDAEDWA